MDDALVPDPTVAAIVSDVAAGFVAELAGPITPEDLADAAAAVTPVSLNAGETLFEAGDAPDAAYFVVAGRLLVVVGDDEGERTLRRMGRGEIVGEVGLLDGSERTATVRADRDTVLARLPREEFDRLAAGHPDFVRSVTSVVIKRLTRPRPPVDRIGTIALAVVSPALDADRFTGDLIAEIERRGTVSALTGGGPAGATVDELRLSQELDRAEATHRFVVLSINGTVGAWAAQAIRRADRVLVVAGRKPDAEEERAIASVMEAARAGGSGVTWLVLADSSGAAPESSDEAKQRFSAHRVIHVDPADPAGMARLARLATGTGLGLVLGGGGARGFAHLGVYRALLEHGLAVDAVAGTSIGAMFGAGIAAGHGPGDFAALAETGFKRVLDYTLPMVSMVKARRMTRSLRRVFGGRAIEDLLLPFACVSSNLTTSRLVVHDSGELVPALRASSSIPGVSPPVPSEGHLLVDGGVLDNLPIDVMRASGLVETVIAVDVAPPVGPGAREDYGLSLSGWRVLWDRITPGRRRLPRFSPVLMRAMLIGSMRERDRLVAGGYADLYLDLDLRGTSLLDFSKGSAVLEAGYEAAEPRVAEWVSDRGGS